ncbi:MAG TPA: CRTAC1 family protein [Acidobacteriaceae bacterium]
MLFRKLVVCGLSLFAIAGLMSCRKQTERKDALAEHASQPTKSSQERKPVADASAAPTQSRPSGPIQFVDVTKAAGIHFRHNNGAYGKKYLPETMGSGVCAIDYDGDGWQDLLFVNSMDWPEQKTTVSMPALYHNNHDGTFTDVTLGSGLAHEMYGMGCAVGDFDNDGRDDIFITALGGGHLFRNMGGGHFADVTAKAHLNDSGFPTGAVWFDYDNDGRLDLFVAHYVTWTEATDQFCSLDGKNKSYCTPELYKGESAKLFHNLGHGVFEDVTKKAGLYDPSSKGMSAALIDYDDDGWLDLFVTNDTQPNKLYHNNHNGTFTDNAFASGVAFSDAGKARAGMGTDAADYDLSGRSGLVIGNFTNESMALYHNDGSGLFEEKSNASGISGPSAKSLTFSAFFFDYDLDGLPDIFAANGHVADDVSVTQPSLKYAEPPLLFRNRGNGRFEDVSNKVGAALRQPVVARGAAYLDYDNDGDLDLVIVPSNGPARLLRNENGNENDVLRVKTIGTRSNRDGIGARVTVRLANGERLSETVKSGSSYLSQSELPLTFGLGKPGEGKMVTVEIRWPSGRRESFKDMKVNQAITLEEGKGIVAQQPIVFAPPTSR